MSAAMRTELREHKHRVYETLKFTIARTAFQYSKKGVMSDSEGLFLPGLKSRSVIPRKLSWPSYGLFEPRVTFEIYDEDRSIQKHLGGPGQGLAKGSPIEFWWRSESVTAANHFQLIDGVIKDFRMPRERTYTIVAGVDDAPLRSKLKIPLKTRAIWPKIPLENEGTPGAIYLGNWLSTGVTGAQGMVEAVLVDEEAGIWYVSYGILNAVDNIQVNGVSDTDFTILGDIAGGGGTQYLQAGRPYTILQDTASTLRTIADTVTCDVVGPTRRGDFSFASSTMVEPAYMLRIALSNFAYNDWPIGAPTPAAGTWAWFSISGGDGAPVDVVSNDTADDDFFDPHNVTASMVLTSDDSGIDIIRTWAETFRCPVGWDLPFEIVTPPIMLNARSPYPTEKISKFLREVKRVEEATMGSDVVTAHRTTYIFNSADGQLAKQRVDGNRFVPERIETPFEFTYGPAEAV